MNSLSNVQVMFHHQATEMTQEKATRYKSRSSFLHHSFSPAECHVKCILYGVPLWRPCWELFDSVNTRSDHPGSWPPQVDSVIPIVHVTKRKHKGIEPNAEGAILSGRART